VGKNLRAVERRASIRTHKGRSNSWNLRIRLSENRFRFSADAVGSKYLPAFYLPLFCAIPVFDEKTSRFTLIRPKMFTSAAVALTGCKPCRRIVPS
jgi:hypothetical protein